MALPLSAHNLAVHVDCVVLRRLTESDEPHFLRAVAAWPSTEEMDFAPKYVATEAFASYVQRLNAYAAGIDLPDGWVPSETLFAFAGEAIVGRLQLRLRLNDFLWKIGGHIGYVVLPEYRRRGYAGRMLRQGLQRARVAGMNCVLITCDPTNTASRRLIESAGGIQVGSAGGPKLRFWVRT